MKNLVLIVVFLLAAAISALGVLPPQANAQTQSDTIRDMLVTVQAKQPDTEVTLYADFAGKYYAPYGPVSRIGDDYACVMQTINNGGQVYAVEKCVAFKWLISVELNPGIHR